jgi:hypothetical protein
VKAAGLAFFAMLGAASPAAAVDFPWSDRDKPPAVSGVQLGDTEQRALDLLGPPDDARQTSNGELLEYRAKGLELTAGDKGISAIRVLAPEAGEIGGVKVGDTATTVILKWGAPKGGEGRTAQFGAGDWLLLVKLGDSNSRVAEMTLARAGRTSQPKPALNIFQTQ